MAHIREQGILEFSTIDAAKAFARNVHGKVHYSVKVDAFLPTGDDRGFPGMTFLTVSRRQFLDAIEGMGRTLVDERGGKIRLHVEPAASDYHSAHVAFY